MPRPGDRGELELGVSRSNPDNLQIWFLFACALAIFSIGEMLLAQPAETIGVVPATAGHARVDAIVQALETRLSPPAATQSDQSGQAYADAIKAMARLRWLEFELAQFERAAAQYDSASEKISPALKQNTQAQDKELELCQNAIINMAKSDLGQSIDLSRHPLYDRHPEWPIAGEEGIANESDKANYRKYQSQFASAKSTIADIKQQYQDEIKRARWVVFRFATDPQLQNTRGDEPNRAPAASGDGQALQRQR